jgi:hypothetical protein
MEVHFWLPNVATWCAELGSCLQRTLPGLTIQIAPPGQLAHVNRRNRLLSAGMARGVMARTTSQRYLTAAQPKKARTHAPAQALLLPLNKDTLEDPLVLADIWAALQVHLPLGNCVLLSIASFC